MPQLTILLQLILSLGMATKIWTAAQLGLSQMA
jgi:hypothetical protein